MLSQILFVSPSGYINNVNMAFPGGGVWGGPGGTGASQNLQGQLGKEIEFTSDMLKYDPAVGTVWGGKFRLVRLATGSGVPVIGQALFWDDSVAENLYQVTTSEAILTYTSTGFAGVCLSAAVTVGNYTIIQTQGKVNVKYRAAIGGTKATGRPVSLANQGAGADLGLFDIVDVDLPQYRVGYAIGLPADGGLAAIDLSPLNFRG